MMQPFFLPLDKYMDYVYGYPCNVEVKEAIEQMTKRSFL